MNSIMDIWQEVLRILKNELTPTAINTWFSDCEPVDLEECRLVIRTPSEFKKTIIENRFASSIKTALTDLFSCDFDLLILVGDEEYEKEDDGASDPFPEMAGYTFENFIVGNSGLGKTHLLMAIGHYIREHFPDKKISYIKGDDFTNELVKAIKEGKTADFRDKYRTVDLFLADDIQFIAGKQSTQVEFFHTFNYIYEAGHQIVITSDRPPMEMSLLDDRLRTRFEGGLMADIAPPDLETRMAIARNKATRLGLILSDEIIQYIATKITINVRQLEGVIKRLTAYMDILNTEITKEAVDRAIVDVVRDGPEIPKPESIIQETAKFYSLQPQDLKGNNRTKNTALARQVAMYLMRNLTNLSLNDIGSELGRNHTTTLSSIRKIEDLMRTDPKMSGIIRDITSNITSSS